MNLLFFGSPRIAVPFLEECMRGHSVRAVITQPDKPSGRGLELTPPPVKSAALRSGIRVFQPVRPSVIAPELSGLKADLAVVVAYGKLLKPELLSATLLGCMNVHFSLLPKYRGAAPIAWTLIRGESRTGVTLFWIDEGMDTGSVQRQAALDIGLEDDALTVSESLTSLGVRELRQALADIAAGRVLRQDQRGEPSLAPKLKSEAARMSLGLEARELHNWVRGLRAGPKAYLPLKLADRGMLRLTILKTALDSAEGSGPVPGTILRVERGGGFLIQCRVGRLWVLEVQPEGKKQLLAADFLNGFRLSPGDRLETAF